MKSTALFVAVAIALGVAVPQAYAQIEPPPNTPASLMTTNSTMTLGDILGEFGSRNIQFVVNAKTFDLDQRLVISVVNRPAEEVMSAVALALDAHWVPFMNIWVLVKNPEGLRPGMPAWEMAAPMPPMPGVSTAAILSAPTVASHAAIATAPMVRHGWAVVVPPNRHPTAPGEMATNFVNSISRSQWKLAHRQGFLYTGQLERWQRDFLSARSFGPRAQLTDGHRSIVIVFAR